jgi:hypothetical protein
MMILEVVATPPIRRAGQSLLLAGLFAGLFFPACADDGSRNGSDSPSGVPHSADVDCLRYLVEKRVPYVAAPPTRGVRTPVEITGPIAGVRLAPRAKRVPLMDCELARALYEAARIIRGVGVDELSFSGAYDYRRRRRGNQLSAHASGLAIDVHELHGPGGSLNIARDFERGRGRWRGLQPADGDLAGCVGSPRTRDGRRLRRLVCRLKHHSAFRVIITPDDDADHRDHLHLEAFPDSVARVSRVLGSRYY